MIATRWRAFAFVLAICTLAVLPAAEARTTVAHHKVADDATVGPLFHSSITQGHSCTAGVVDSPAGDVIVTAAHCVSGSGVGMLFAPGYTSDGVPYGVWRVVAAYAGSGWLAHQSPEEDYVFLVVEPTRGSRSVQSVVGGNRLSKFDGSTGTRIDVSGYPQGVDDDVNCSAVIYLTDGFPSFACGGFAGGTSGSPWLVTPRHGADRLLVGVIGGLDQGGCTDDVSYSSPFDATTLAVYARAVARSAPSTMPIPKSNGC